MKIKALSKQQEGQIPEELRAMRRFLESINKNHEKTKQN